MANYKIKQTSAFKNDLKTYSHRRKLNKLRKELEINEKEDNKSTDTEN